MWKFLEKALSVFSITSITREVQKIRIEENFIITRNRKIEKNPEHAEYFGWTIYFLGSSWVALPIQCNWLA